RCSRSRPSARRAASTESTTFCSASATSVMSSSGRAAPAPNGWSSWHVSAGSCVCASPARSARSRPGTAPALETRWGWGPRPVPRTTRQRSRARLRREVEPVDRAALGRLLVAWHGLDRPRKGGAALLDAVERLQGAPIPASDLEARVLPARVAEYDARDLDALL